MVSLNTLIGMMLVPLAFIGVQPASAANLIVNGGFTTGDFTGWVNGGDTGFTTVLNNGAPIHGGSSFYADLGPVGDEGTLSQTVNTLAGHTYDFTFSLTNAGDTPNDFSVSLGSNPVSFVGTSGAPNLPVSEPGVASFPFTQYDTKVVAAATGETLQFTFRNDPDFWGLTNVSLDETGPSGGVSAVPLPGGLLLFGSALCGLGLIARKRRGV